MIQESTTRSLWSRARLTVLMFVLGLTALCVLSLSACAEKAESGEVSSEASPVATESATQSSTRTSIESDAQVMDAYDWSFSDRDLDPSYDAASATVIELADGEVSIEGTGASTSGSIVTINEEGCYILSGSLNDGSIVVDLADENAKAQLVLDGVDISCSNGAAILVENADKVFITLAEGANNTLSDSGAHELGSDGNDHDGVVFSHDDLTLQGTGSLTVNASYDNGIVGKNDVRITGGSYTISAAGHGIQGKDCVKILDGDFSITSGADGIQASNDEDETLGYLGIGGGSYVIDAGDDAFHADSALLIADGTIDIIASYEGFEGKSVSLTGATTSVYADDDGVNAASGDELVDNQGFMVPGGAQGTQAAPGSSATESECFIEITGGTHLIRAGGDCLDSNGTISISGGQTIAECFASGGNSALDCEGGSQISGGTFLSVGPSDMAQSFSVESSQASVFLNASSTNLAAELLSVVDAQGNEVCSFTPSITGRSFLFSSPDLVEGESYTVMSGSQEVGSTTAELSSQAGFGGMQGGAPGIGGGEPQGSAPGAPR